MLHDIVVSISSLIHDLVQLAVGLAWPIVLLVAVVLLRRQLASLIEAATRQGFKVSGAGIALEINAARALPAPEVAFGQLGEPLPSSAVAGSGSNELERLFVPPTALDYAVIDLRTGRSWLTSRIYLFALMLRRMRSIQEFVFVQTSDGVVGSFLAHAPVERIRWRLAQLQPWLEAAFAASYGGASWSGPYPARITSDLGGLDYGQAMPIVGTFLAGIQRQKKATSTETGWVDVTVSQAPGVPAGQWEEHATWVDGVALQEMLKGLLVFDSVLDDPALPQAQRIEAIVRRKTQFVALVDSERRFRELVDRRPLLERAIQT